MIVHRTRRSCIRGLGFPVSVGGLHEPHYQYLSRVQDSGVVGETFNGLRRCEVEGIPGGRVVISCSHISGSALYNGSNNGGMPAIALSSPRRIRQTRQE